MQLPTPPYVSGLAGGPRDTEPFPTRSPATPVHAEIDPARADTERPLVLVVDDDPRGAEVLIRSLDRLGYAAIAADGGHAALAAIAAIAATPPDVVILDVVMPGLSGLEVLRRLRAEPATADLPVIPASALGRPEDIVDGLKLGANDYVTKPIHLPIPEAKLATRTALKRSRDELKRMVLVQATEIERRARELEMARRVQRSILPRVPTRSATLATPWCYEPATEVGGDLFDVIPLPGGRTLLFVADAMGHGVQAALVVATVKATLSAHLDEADDLPILTGLLDLAVTDLFVTAAACVVDPVARRLRYCVAGHPPVLVSGPSGVAALEAGSPPLGLGLGLSFAGAGEIELTPGASILLYTDGLTEAWGGSGFPSGGAALADAFAALSSGDPDLLVRGLRSTLAAFHGPGPLEDDLTILAAHLI